MRTTVTLRTQVTPEEAARILANPLAIGDQISLECTDGRLWYLAITYTTDESNEFARDAVAEKLIQALNNGVIGPIAAIRAAVKMQVRES